MVRLRMSRHKTVRLTVSTTSTAIRRANAADHGGRLEFLLFFPCWPFFLCRVQGRQTRRQSKGQRTGVDKQEATQLEEVGERK
jgi:hypothetical protein